MSIKSILFGQIDIKARTVNIALLLIRFYAGYTIKTLILTEVTKIRVL